jgi:hypothetical protein
VNSLLKANKTTLFIRNILMQLSNSPFSSPSDSEKNMGISTYLKHAFVIFSLIYLACIPLGQLGKEKRFTPVDMGILVIALIVNSDVKLKDMIDRVSSAKITATSAEFTLVEKKVEKLLDQDRADAEAKILVDLQLSETGYKNVNPSELCEKILSASSSAKETIYTMAKNARRNGSNKTGIIERTIPIFQALIDSNYESACYRFYAQLGYALKDSLKPDWGEATNKLDTAITLWEEKHPTDEPPSLYCFNWLFCAAHLEDKPGLEQEEINKRIKAATVCKSLYAVIKEEKHKNIHDWMCKNYTGDISTLTPEFSNLNGYCRKDSDEQKKLLCRV